MPAGCFRRIAVDTYKTLKRLRLVANRRAGRASYRPPFALRALFFFARVFGYAADKLRTRDLDSDCGEHEHRLDHIFDFVAAVARWLDRQVRGDSQPAGCGMVNDECHDYNEGVNGMGPKV